MNKNNKLKILPYLLLTLYYFLKDCNINKAIILLLIYKLLKFIFNIILNAINKINYKNTITGFLHTLYKENIKKIKKIIYYYLLANFNLLTVYKQIIPARLYRIAGFHYDVGIKSLIISFAILIYSIISDFYCK